MIATVKIDSIAAGGDGVGRADGLAVFVPRTAPGDLVRAEIAPQGRFARGLMIELLVASADRVDPPCRHYVHDACGGCQLQQLAYPAQLAAKQRIVRDAIARIGKRETALPFIRQSPGEWRYRSKLTLAMRRRGERWIAGLHRYDEPSRIFALTDCPITRREIVRVWRDVLAAADHFPPERRLRGSVRATSDGFAFLLIGGTRWDDHRALFEATPSLTSLWWEPEDAQVRLLHTRAGFGAGHDAAAASFTQVNPEVAAELRKHVIERTRAHGPAHVIDAYAGVGDIAAALAADGMQVTAIELDRHAAAVAAGRLTAPSLAIAGSVEDNLSRALPADVVLVNPPRAGLAPAVTAALASATPRPRAIVYTSCNPATLARDLQRLERFRIESVLAFDMFPQTAHVETVCELVPEP